MDEEYKKWFEKAEKDLVAAEKSIKSGEFEWAGFQIQQSVEKALKALGLKKNKELLKIHDLVVLGKKVGLPEKFFDYCEDISKLYIYSRYPDSPKISDIEVVSTEYLCKAKEIIKWVKEKI